MSKEHEIMSAAVSSAEVVRPHRVLQRIRADELQGVFHAPDALVDNLLHQVSVSMLFGESNSGKTFLAVDLGASVALGHDWLGLKVEPGAVVYLAVESPASIKQRVAAYQKHHGVALADMHVITSSVNLYSEKTDVDAVIQAVREVSVQQGKPVRLVIGDTLSRLSAGANENAAQDMSVVIERAERIAKECATHVMLIHHSGKDSSAGARGWSGINAAVETELKVTASSAGIRCLEVTKQRDFGTKGRRYGFQLLSVPMGANKWNSTVTSCVVLPAEAPKKQAAVRTSVLDAKILAALQKHASMTKQELVNLLKADGSKPNIYRRIKELSSIGQVSVHGVLVSLTDSEVQMGADASVSMDQNAGN